MSCPANRNVSIYNVLGVLKIIISNDHAFQGNQIGFFFGCPKYVTFVPSKRSTCPKEGSHIRKQHNKTNNICNFGHPITKRYVDNVRLLIISFGLRLFFRLRVFTFHSRTALFRRPSRSTRGIRIFEFRQSLFLCGKSFCKSPPSSCGFRTFAWKLCCGRGPLESVEGKLLSFFSRKLV